jgi:hypothetical protein
MIFLGAGASKPYGIPTLEEFSEEILSKLRQIGHDEVIENVLSSLKEFNMTIDFESFYSILEGLINPISSVQYAGPLTAFLVRNKRNLPKGYDYSRVLSDLRRLIYEKCSIISSEENFKKVEECMDKLLKATRQNHCDENSITSGNQGVNIGKTFVTTNYDMALELYFLSREIPIIDGYEDSGAIVKHFQPSLLSNPYTSAHSRTVLKLHGSIWQFLSSNEMIKTKLDPISGGLPFKIQVEKEMMIYPTREKDILIYPYFYFFEAFKNIRWTKLLVIGYSFRDEPVNTAILENMKYTDNSQLIVIDPEVDRAVDNLYQYVPDSIKWQIPKQRLFKFSGKFGTDEVYEYLQRIERVSDNQDPTFDPSAFIR